MKKLTAKSLRAGQTIWYARFNPIMQKFEVASMVVWPDSREEPHPSIIPQGYPRKALARYVAAGNGPLCSYSRRRLLTIIENEERAYRQWSKRWNLK